MKTSLRAAIRRSGKLVLKLAVAAAMITLFGGADCEAPCNTKIHHFGVVRGSNISPDMENPEAVFVCPGEQVTLGWLATSDVTTGTVNGIGSVTVPLGTTTISPQDDAKYRLTVKGQCEKKSAELIVNVVKPGDKAQLSMVMHKNTDGLPVGWDLTLSANAYSPNIVVKGIKIVLPQGVTKVTCSKKLQPSSIDANFEINRLSQRPQGADVYMVGYWHIEPSNWSELGVDFNDPWTWQNVTFPNLTVEVVMACP